jgi:ribosomal protein L4
MKADILSAKGESKGKIDLPAQFSERHHPIIIKRAFNANMSLNYQHHGTDPRAGLKKAVELSKMKRLQNHLWAWAQ